MSGRPELSLKNDYHISKHRYYELKHFCLQYPEWKERLNDISLIKSSYLDPTLVRTEIYKPVEDLVDRRLIFEDRIKTLVDSAKETDEFLWKYILIGVTEGKSFDILRLNHRLPTYKDEYYRMYRKFFYILDKIRN